MSKETNKKLSKDNFFSEIEKLKLALTFDDVRLKSGYSEVMPEEVSTNTKFSKNINLKIPIVSAAMDTVTEHKMGVEMALLGGIGIVHKNMSIKEQAKQVAKVKYYLNGFIDKPICVDENDTIDKILRMKEERNYSFNTFPVINSKQQIVGIISRNDFDFCQNNSLPVKEIMSKNPITAPEKTSLKKAYQIMIETKKKVLPVIDNNKKIIGMYTFKDLKRIIVKDENIYNTDKNGQLVVGAAIGVNDFERLEALLEKKVNVIVIDTAHGDTKSVITTLQKIKKDYTVDVVVGNISEPESAKRLIKNGADGIKVGQGPGSICTTRIIAGIGSPQLTAVYKCAKIANKYNIPVCADGGLKYSGDIPIAIGAGASSVMMGGMLSGTDESPGEVIFKDGRQWKAYRGMGSLGAMHEHSGARERYNQNTLNKKDLIAEGVEALKPYKGKLSNVILQYVGGLKRGMGYVGAKNIEELKNKADFVRISGAGKAESHPHNIIITKEPPNYSQNY